MNDKIIFFNTGWMDFYKGIKNDSIIGGGKHVQSEGWGGEMFNFQNFNEKYYGYVQPKIDRKHNNLSSVKLEKIGGKIEEDVLENVTVVWTATNPKGGTYIIGWYKNATVYRYEQKPPKNSNRRYKNVRIGYYASAENKNVKLLPKEERTVRVKRQEENWMGQSNVWYAEKNPQFITIVKNYIFNGVTPRKPVGKPRQSDPLKRIEVEKKAILHVTEHFKKLGYEIKSVEKDNVGWDLIATLDNINLKLEVKGLSGINFATELTPNEFKNLNANLENYRICIVANALQQPDMKIFSYSSELKNWASNDGIILKFQEVVSARIYI